jgi:hypothetical protein
MYLKELKSRILFTWYQFHPSCLLQTNRHPAAAWQCLAQQQQQQQQQQ